MTQNKNGTIMHSFPQVSRVIDSLDIHRLTFSIEGERACNCQIFEIEHNDIVMHSRLGLN